MKNVLLLNQKFRYTCCISLSIGAKLLQNCRKLEQPMKNSEQDRKMIINFNFDNLSSFNKIQKNGVQFVTFLFGPPFDSLLIF